jgi:hypothetical protein
VGETRDPERGKDWKKGFSLILYSMAEKSHNHDGGSLFTAVK